MDLKKYNLFINNTFEDIKFTDNRQSSVFKVDDNNLVDYYVILTLSDEHNSNLDSTDLNIGDNVILNIFPTNTNNVEFVSGDIIKTIDNNAIFIIQNNISSNIFSLKLVLSSNNINYTLYNNTITLLYNEQLEKYYKSTNDNAKLTLLQKENYTKYINDNDKFIEFITKNITINTDYTSSYEIVFDFTNIEEEYLLISNIIDKFYLNILAFDYSNFKFIYKTDIIQKIDDNNMSISSTNVTGVMKTMNTKIMPHIVQKLNKNNVYRFTNSIINKYTSHSKSYSGEKILLLLQLSLEDKQTIYTPDNIESDSIFIIT